MKKRSLLLMVLLSLGSSTVIASEPTADPAAEDLVWPCWSWDPSCIPYNDVT